MVEVLCCWLWGVPGRRAPAASRAALSALVWLGLIGLSGPGCEADQQGQAGVLLPDLMVEALGPAPVVPGTWLVIDGAGFLPPEIAAMTVVLRGEVAGLAVEVAAAPVREGDDRLRISVIGDLADALLADAPASFVGEVVVRREPLAEGAEPAEAALDVSFPVEHVIAPNLASVSPTIVYPGDELLLEGGGFLHPSEGVSLVAFDGTFSTTSPPAVQAISGLLIPAVPPDATSRDVLALVLTPDIFGVRPGVFAGTLQVWNQSHAGDTGASGAWAPPGGLVLSAPVVDAVGPLAASRGQRVDFEGRGLLPPDGLLQAGTLLVLEGLFDPDRGPQESLLGTNALALFPDDHQGNAVASVVLRVDRNLDGELVGLGREPGLFTGTASALVFFGSDSVLGPALPLTFTIKAPRQMVYLKFLAAFDEALVEFGLLAEREAVVARVLEAVHRDYAGINIAFLTSPPEDFVEYSTVEIGGEDPNGSGLFGLDNTKGKDVGNVRFDDVIGGFNAETRARGFAAYGGIFVAELLKLSPTLSDIDLASYRFDEIFGPLAPPLGGIAAEEGEAAAGGERATVIAEAVRVLGNLAANTITHEVGHSLGLAHIDGQFHNVGDNPGWIMDAGVFRPFEERAEVDGFGPAVFSEVNRTYLEQILPLDE